MIVRVLGIYDAHSPTAVILQANFTGERGLIQGLLVDFKNAHKSTSCELVRRLWTNTVLR